MPPRRTLSPEERKTLGDNLAAKREARRLSQGAAAKKAQLKQSMLSEWEGGKRTPYVDGLLRLAIAYECHLDDFFSGVDERYDAVIESRIPIDAQRFYKAKTETFIRRTTAAMQLALGPGASAPIGEAHASALPKAHGKSARARAPRKSPKKK